MKNNRSGLTYQQENDCHKVGRSPRTGRHFPEGQPTPAQVSARELNWRKLLIKGAVGSLRHVASIVGITLHVSGKLDDVERLLLAASAEKHEAAKRFQCTKKNNG